MCQSQAEGGKRCAKGNRIVSNWPHIVDINESTHEITLTAESFSSRPELALHAAVLSARTGFPLSQETIDAANKVASEFHKIPKKKIWEQWNYLLLAEKPSAGLDAIHKMGWENNFPELAAIRGVPQSPIWHPEGPVEIHTAQAADIAARRAKEEGIGEDETRVAVMGAICHDFGKAVCTQIDDDGKISSSGHDDEGYPISKSFLERIGASKSVTQQVPLIVREHMCHANQPTYKNTRKLIARLDNNGKGTTLEAWARVAEADRAGRGSAGDSGVSKKWLELKNVVDTYKETQFKRLVSGETLRNNGCTDFDTFGAIIREATKMQQNGVIKNEEEALQWLRKNNHIS